MGSKCEPRFQIIPKTISSRDCFDVRESAAINLPLDLSPADGVLTKIFLNRVARE
jgi:hypothetical protein